MTEKSRTKSIPTDPLQGILLGLAHELNNPNTFIRMSASNLQKFLKLALPAFEEFEKNHPGKSLGLYSPDEIRTKMSAQINHILAATVRLVMIADKLKNLTNTDLQSEAKVKLTPLLKTLLETYSFLFKANGIEVFLESKPGADNLATIGHSLQLEQAFGVLITNAVDAIRMRPVHSAILPGVIKLTLNVLIPSNTVQIIFKDNGIGIPKESLDRIFEAYYTTKPQGEGEGLGLAIFKSIIERHQGKIEMKSEQGVGSEFTVFLPLAPAN